jgi:hypothetical protein
MMMVSTVRMGGSTHSPPRHISPGEHWDRPRHTLGTHRPPTQYSVSAQSRMLSSQFVCGRHRPVWQMESPSHCLSPIHSGKASHRPSRHCSSAPQSSRAIQAATSVHDPSLHSRPSVQSLSPSHSGGTQKPPMQVPPRKHVPGPTHRSRHAPSTQPCTKAVHWSSARHSGSVHMPLTQSAPGPHSSAAVQVSDADTSGSVPVSDAAIAPSLARAESGIINPKSCACSLSEFDVLDSMHPPKKKSVHTSITSDFIGAP